MKQHALLIGSASFLALMATPAAAQTDPSTSPDSTAAAAAASEGDNGEIVVTGIRQSLRKSISAKRNADVVQDVITAEDIGKFPDKNVAEALQRVPGVVINREFGEGERVSLRATAPNLTKTLVNGHAIATADWFVLEQLSATRSFNYLTLPAEIVGTVEVYKSPQADVEEGGIGGTINVHTRNPLDLDAFTLTGSAQMVYSSLRKSWDPQASGLFSWKNDAETFGVLVGAVYQKRDIRRDGVEVLGYFTQPTASGPVLVPSLIGSALFKQERERYGANVGLQFKPTDDLEINVTGLYSKFGADNFNQNYLAWGSNALGGGGTLTNAQIEDGTAVSGTITSTPGGRAVVYDAIDRKAFAKTWSADFDAKWQVSDAGTLHFKTGYTEAHGDTTAQPFYEGGAPGAFTYDLTGRAPKVSFTGVDPTDPSDLAFDFGSLHKITNTDKEKYAYVDYEHEIGSGILDAVKFGGKYTDHDRKTVFLATTYGGFFLPLLAQGCGGPCDSTDFAGGLTPGDFLDGVASPGTLTSFWQVDRQALEDIYFSQPASVRARIINPPENHSISEKALGGYGMLKLKGDGWRGNVGVRVVRTRQTSTGNLIGVPAGPDTVNDNAFGVYLPVTAKRSYTDVLPSANVAIDLNPNLVLRLAVGRTVARPDYTDIVPRVNLNPGSLTAAGGDPRVEPYRANQADASLEWYPDRDTLVAAAVFFKDIKSYITDDISQEVFPVQTATPNLSRCTPANPAENLYNCTFDVNRRANGPGGTNKGFEIQAQRNLWGGFGAIVNYTFADANFDGEGEVPGVSKHALNLTGYFENSFLSARLSYNYRSKFFITYDRAAPLNQKATASLDASVSANINRNVALTFDAINLTEEKIEQYSGTTTRPRGIYNNGRQFYVGARFRF
ncbi:TonB-dependent receptor [Sphingomonas piscis]|uniref:TonB-dependent receptor n=1 Tax=Sphingomonas piscis TaxID=2714943 RepID=A0A6G7YPB9_9SPHN|nr:TonB-dependent receptor [Sphingomonas piscis]QIK78584.1 TonB-dependent receptor [Sphingomonas piscis]